MESEGEQDGNQYPYPWETAKPIVKSFTKCCECGGELEPDNIARCNSCKEKIEPAKIKSTSWEANKQRIMEGFKRLVREKKEEENAIKSVKSALF